MPITILDAQDAPHSAVMDVQGWVDEFIEEFMRPLIEMQQARTVEQVVMMFEQMPPEMHAQMERQDPEKHAQIMRAVEELKKRGKNARPD